MASARFGLLQQEHLPTHSVQFIDVCAAEVSFPCSGFILEIAPRLFLGHFLWDLAPNSLRHNQPKAIIPTRQSQNFGLGKRREPVLQVCLDFVIAICD
jgi:hypothetical protein